MKVCWYPRGEKTMKTGKTTTHDIVLCIAYIIGIIVCTILISVMLGYIMGVLETVIDNVYQ